MDLKIPKGVQDVSEQVAFIFGFSIYTAQKVLDDFPITKVNEYIYTIVLIITVVVGIKRIWCWFKKSNKNPESEGL